MRTLLGASGMKLHKRFTLEILKIDRLASCFPWTDERSYFPLSPETPRWVWLRASFGRAAIRAKLPLKS